MTTQTTSVVEKIALAKKALETGELAAYALANPPSGIQTKVPTSWGPAMRR